MSPHLPEAMSISEQNRSGRVLLVAEATSWAEAEPAVAGEDCLVQSQT